MRGLVWLNIGYVEEEVGNKADKVCEDSCSEIVRLYPGRLGKSWKVRKEYCDVLFILKR